jgi:lipopolysaccharide/colanic/teichoic acid biosynthesis glycosyltransferase
MLKRLFDIVLSAVGLLIASPVLITVCFLVWRQDKHSPFYIATRVGKDGKLFEMVKLRSMVINADKSGVDSTSANDNRITAVGHFIRKYKLDELSQLWNVLKGDMSLVGPRPNVERETNLYTQEERKLLTVKPGITGISSIVFADEGEILKNSEDPDLDYNQLIRPGKSCLGIFYCENKSFLLDLQLIYLTVVVSVSRKRALNSLSVLLEHMGAIEELKTLVLRDSKLVPKPPPGADEVVISRNGGSV